MGEATVSSSAPKKYVNAYVDGEHLVLLTRDGDRIKFERTQAEYATFVFTRELPQEMARMLGSSSAVRGMKTEGSYTRINWVGDFTRREMCSGKRIKSDTGEYALLPSPLMSAGISIYEGDVDPVRRFMTDTGSGVQPPLRCYLDIESDSRVSFADAAEGKARVLMWCVIDAQTGAVKTGVLEEDTDNDEYELLAALWAAIEPYDQVLAWNLDNFDGPVITQRSDKVRCRIDPRRWLWLDHLALFKRMNTASESGDEKQSMALQNVAMGLLGEGKDETPPEVVAAFGNRPMGALAWELWRAGGRFRDLLCEYMIQDTRLLMKIEEKTGYAALFDTLCDVCRVFPNSQGLNPTMQVDGFLLRLGLERDHRFKTKQYRDSIDQFPGAYVMAPKTRGVTKDVHVGDFASLYPSIIITWNMSPETKVQAPINGPIAEGCCRAPSTGITFRVRDEAGNPVEGILAAALKVLLSLRTEWNKKKAQATPGTPEWKEADRRSTAYKVAANSFYGVIGSPFSRYYDREIGESVTQNGKWLIQQTIAAAEERGMRCIYGDTDSLFIVDASRTEFEQFVEWCNATLYPELLAKTGCIEVDRKIGGIKLAYEKQFARIVFTSAKRYAGSYVHYKGKAGRPVPLPGETFDKDRHSKPEIKGLEYKRGDTALLARRLQEQIIMRVLAGDESNANYKLALDEACQHVLQGELPIEEVRITQALTKSLREYVPRQKKDGTDGAELAHVQIAKILKERGREITAGTRIEYIISDGSDSPNKVIPAEDYDGTNADRFHLWEDKVWPPTKRFLEAAFPDWTWAAWDKRRPPKPRAPRKGKPVSENQLMFDIEIGEPYRLLVDERHATLIADIVEVLKRHQGKRPVIIEVLTPDGVATIESKSIFVTGSEEMQNELHAMWLEFAGGWDAPLACNDGVNDGTTREGCNGIGDRRTEDARWADEQLRTRERRRGEGLSDLQRAVSRCEAVGRTRAEHRCRSERAARG